MLDHCTARTCDFTVGGLFMWAGWFGYSKCITGDTLFIKGLSESDRTTEAYSLPVGRMPLEQSIPLLKAHCRAAGKPLLLSAVPEEAVERLRALGATSVEELPQWADYLYDLQSLATFAGKKLNKKRNHINRFIADNPGYTVEPLTAANADEARQFYSRLQLADNKPLMAEYDRLEVMSVLDSLGDYPFEGALLKVPGRGVAAFALGEIAGDTLVVHIEKIDHSVAGAGEMICREFAAMMAAAHPQLRYENREDDANDPGLRQAKQSLNPCALLRKFNVCF